MLVLSVDRTGPEPLHAQLASQIRRRIREGHLPPGTRLPSTRTLAHDAGVGRNTVVSAYDRLVAEGWLDSGVGQGTFVADHPPDSGGTPRGAEARHEDGPLRPPQFAWSSLVARHATDSASGALLAPAGAEDGYRFAGAVPDAASYPTESLQRIARDVFRDAGPDALGYGPADGHRPLREFIAARATREGAPARPDDVMIVGGMQQGLDLLARLFVTDGDVVVVESPTYANAIEIWRLYGARVVGVPLDEDGVDPIALARTLADTRPKLVYLMPSFQNPTGLTMSLSRRREVLDVARDASVAIVENHFDTELRYDGRALPPLRAFDTCGQVILVGTFSKMLCPGFRLGWILAPPAVRDRLLALKRVGDLSTSLPSQMIVSEFCRRGELDRHIARVRKHHAARRDAMLDALSRSFPSTVAVTRPEGGMTIWCTLPPPGRARVVAERALERGVSIAPGEWFHPDGGGERSFRLSFVGETPERIRSGIEILARVVREHLATASDRPPRRRSETPFL